MIELNKVYNEDCLITMKNMDNDSIDMVITSPPYDSLRNYQGYEFEFEKIATELFRIIKPGGVVVWVVGDMVINGSESGTSFKQALYFKSIGFNIHDTMIYLKNNLLFQNNKRYEQAFEYMFVFSKGSVKTFNPILEKKISPQKRHIKMFHRGINDGERRVNKCKQRIDKLKTNVWQYNVGGGHTTKDKIAFQHPAIFPDKLVIDHITSWSNENNIVYDPFGGSGTVAKICILTNRNWILSEISKKYCNIIHKRIDKYSQQIDFKK